MAENPGPYEKQWGQGIPPLGARATRDLGLISTSFDFLSESSTRPIHSLPCIQSYAWFCSSQGNSPAWDRVKAIFGPPVGITDESKTASTWKINTLKSRGPSWLCLNFIKYVNSWSILTETKIMCFPRLNKIYFSRKNIKVLENKMFYWERKRKGIKS